MAKIESKIKAGVSEIKIKIVYKSNPSPIIAAYTYELKTPDANTPIQKYIGDNINSEDDIYTLPTPVSANKGRYVLLKSDIGATDTDADIIVNAFVLQDGEITDTLISEGQVKADGNSVLKLDMIKFI